MNATLLTTGLICIIAAIVGGSLKGFGIELPLIASGKRQMGLGLFGAVLLGTAVLSTRPPIEPERVARQPTLVSPVSWVDLRGKQPVSCALPADAEPPASVHLWLVRFRNAVEHDNGPALTPELSRSDSNALAWNGEIDLASGVLSGTSEALVFCHSTFAGDRTDDPARLAAIVAAKADGRALRIALQ